MVTEIAFESGLPAELDRRSRKWLMELRGRGVVRDDAVRRLHELLLRMAYARLLPLRGHVDAAGLDELALDVAGDSLVAVLAHLDDFRGRSRFTTWACQFAVTEVSVALRRHRRRRREFPVEPQVIVQLSGSTTGVERELEQMELLRLVCEAVAEVLSERQRRVLLALAVDGDSPSALASELGTNAGALYKTLHDARQKLRVRLVSRGIAFADDDAGDGRRGR
jgi:RNA polymerase sigma-70 factor (ECF subfamily)